MHTMRPSMIPNYYIDCIGFEKVNKHERMLKCLGLKDHYLTTIVKNLENYFYGQDPGSEISKIVLPKAPEFKTGLLHTSDAQSRGIIKGIISKLTVHMDIDVYLISSIRENFIYQVTYTFQGQDLDNDQRKVKVDMKITGEELNPNR
jgi:hypothetical protein